MGSIVSFLRYNSDLDPSANLPFPSPSPSPLPASSTSEPSPSTPPSPAPRPSHIPIPPLPIFGTWSLSPSPSHRQDDPFADPIPSPALHFYTAPSSPQVDPPTAPSPLPSSSPGPRPGSPLPTVPHAPPHPPNSALSPPVEHQEFSDESFPSIDLAIDLALDDQDLSPLEKIYLFSQSKATFHRVFIAHSLPSFLEQVAPQEAILYVLPLLSVLAMDEEEQVKVALAAELVHIIWWFFSNCQLVPEGFVQPIESFVPSVIISVQAFTPIMGTLLLSSNPLVGGTARYAVVELLTRMKKADDRDTGHLPMKTTPTSLGDTTPRALLPHDDDDSELLVGTFGPSERVFFRQELLQQVVIGMGRLDIEELEDDTEDCKNYQHLDDSWGKLEAQIPFFDDQQNTETTHLEARPDMNNSYFPIFLPSNHEQSPASSASSTPSSTTGTTASSSDASSSGSPNIGHSPSVGFSPVTAGPPPSSPSVYTQSTPQEPSPPPKTPRLTGRQPSPPPDARSPSSPRPAQPSDLRQHSTSPPVNYSEFDGDGNWPTSHERSIEGESPASEEESEQAAVGRLSSMSLMAAVTASGSLGEEVKDAFVQEVLRVGTDPVYWVRREAVFALGALAKVVSEDSVRSSLLPLFESLRKDPSWEVRHSILFALPAILARLLPVQRYELAMDTLIPLSTDESQTVRTGVLESLGEVLHTFHGERDGPPQELIDLFLGRKEDRCVRNGKQHAATRQHIVLADFVSIQFAPIEEAGRPTGEKVDPLESFYTDPERPHICAFNYPAVAFTLGRARWSELRGAYLDITDNRATRVRKTIAASLGELAKIIGEEQAENDLLGVWWNSIRCEEPEVRIKAVECAGIFAAALRKDAAIGIVRGLEGVWDEGVLQGWREREGVARAVLCLVDSISLDISSGVKGLFRRALEDTVSAVREVAVSAVPSLFSTLKTRPDALAEIRTEVHKLALSDAHRKRMTFVACQQALAMDGSTAIITDDLFWPCIERLANDPITGVRIGIARLAGTLSDAIFREKKPLSGKLAELVQHMSSDASHEVQSYVSDALVNDFVHHNDMPGSTPLPSSTPCPRRRNDKSSTFSRPPLQRVSTRGMVPLRHAAEDVRIAHGEPSSIQHDERIYSGPKQS